MRWRSKLGKGMAVVGAGCLALAGLSALTDDERSQPAVSAGVVAAAEPDPGRDDKERGKREGSTTSTSAENDRAGTTTSTRRRSQASSSTSTTSSTAKPAKRSATSTTTTTEAGSPRSSGAAATTSSTAGPTSTTASTAPAAATTTTTAPSSVPTALATEPASGGGNGGNPVGAAQIPEPESRGPRLPTASTAPRQPAAPAAPVPSSASADASTTTATTSPAVAFDHVGPNGIGGADLPADQLQGAVPGEAPATPAAPAAVPTPAKTRRPGGVLGMTGSATRTMLMMAGVILLLGALIVGFGESMTRARGPLPGQTVAAAWGETVPLAPSKREKARRRAGIRSP